VFASKAIAALLLFSTSAQAAAVTGATSGGAYDLLVRKGDSIAAENRVAGWSFVVSGGAALGVSIPGYFLSNDLFSKTVYSLGETLAVASVGYGSYLLLIDDEYTRFRRVITQVPSLSVDERNRLAQAFLEENAARARGLRRIRVITHSLTAGLNFLNGFTAEQTELKTALFFLGGINVLAAVGFGLRKSEEEEMAPATRKSASVDFSVGAGARGPYAGVSWRF
jgi:hypothetical protein